MPTINTPVNEHTPTSLAFNNVDSIKNYNTTEIPSSITSTQEHKISAPKTIERLEELSSIRNEKRKQEEDEEEYDSKIHIYNNEPNVKLDVLDIHDLNKKIEIDDTPILGEITTLI